MIAHVAEATEDRGRVVVRLGSLTLSSRAALESAVHVARAFQSEIEGVFVENPDLFEAAAHGFVREVGSFAGRPRLLSDAVVVADTSHFAVAIQRQLSEIAALHRIPFKARSIRHDVIPALARACAERGPWNIVAFAEPIVDEEGAEMVAEALASVFGATGYIVASRRAHWRRGPIVVAAEDTDRVAGQLRVARGLAAVDRDGVAIVAVGADEVARDWLDAEVRLIAGESGDVRVLSPLRANGPSVALHAGLSASHPRMIIARNGGIVAPAADLPRALASLPCPVFLTH